MHKNPVSVDEYLGVGSDDFEQIMQNKADRAAQKEAKRRALSEEEVHRIDEANLEAMQKLFKRYGGHRRHVAD